MMQLRLVDKRKLKVLLLTDECAVFTQRSREFIGILNCIALFLHSFPTAILIYKPRLQVTDYEQHLNEILQFHPRISPSSSDLLSHTIKYHHIYMNPSHLLRTFLPMPPKPYTSPLPSSAGQYNTELLMGDKVQELKHCIKKLEQETWGKFHWEEGKGMYGEHLAKGLFEMKIMVNYVNPDNDHPASYIRSNLHYCHDNIIISNLLVNYNLLLGQLHQVISPPQLTPSLSSLHTLFHDHNHPTTTPVYGFWQQAEKQNGKYHSYGSNLEQVNHNLHPNPTIRQLRQQVFKLPPKGFSILPDFDDSCLVLVMLGAMWQTNHPQYQMWKQLNSNVKELFDLALHYAYRPLGTDINRKLPSNNYYGLRQFLDSKQGHVVLPSTFIGNNQLVYPTVDLVVCVNILHAFCYCLLMGMLEPTTELVKMITDTTEFIVFSLQNNNEQTQHYLLAYYPCKSLLFCFVSRLLATLRRNPTKHQILIWIKKQLDSVRKTVTDLIIRGAHVQDGQCYWVQFLGNFAGKTRNQDSLVTTTLMVSALLDMWTLPKQNHLEFSSQTPYKLETLIEQSIQFISKQAQKTPIQCNYDLFNYLTLLDKNFEAFPNHDDGMINYYVPKEQYQQQLEENDIPEYHPNDGEGSLFYFWISEPWACSQILEVLGKYLKVQKE